MWDVHWRIGGSAGTLLQSDNCTKTPDVLTPANSTCIAAYMLMHITKTGSVYMENNWGWVADHESGWICFQLAKFPLHANDGFDP